MIKLIRTGRDRWWYVVLGALGVCLGLLAYTNVRLNSVNSAQVRQAKVATALSSYLAGAQSQLKQHGITPSQPAPSQIIAQVGPPGPQGSQGPGPSDEQVAAAVAAYLQQHPIAGQPPTTDQIAAVVAVYLAQHPAPSGAPGPTGSAGPGPSDAQIADAVAVWEQGHPVATVTGPTGPSGPAGPAGVAGSAGAPGPSGEPGASGAPGQDPSGWTYKDALGVTHTCTPDSATPSPQYGCS